MSDSKLLRPAERFRAYLLLLARAQLGTQARAKVDASDIVQQTLLEAHRSRDGYRGQSDQEMAGWLRQILATKMLKAFRDQHRAKRDSDRERSLQAALDASSLRLENWLAAQQPTPSQNLQRRELMVELADALLNLPEDQREALYLHYCEGWPLLKVSEHLGRSVPSIGGLLQRGLAKLRTLLQE